MAVLPATFMLSSCTLHCSQGVGWASPVSSTLQMGELRHREGRNCKDRCAHKAHKLTRELGSLSPVPASRGAAPATLWVQHQLIALCLAPMHGNEGQNPRGSNWLTVWNSERKS